MKRTTQKQAMPRITCIIPRRPLMQANVEFVLQHPISTSVEGSTKIFPTAQTPESEPRRIYNVDRPSADFREAILAHCGKFAASTQVINKSEITNCGIDGLESSEHLCDVSGKVEVLIVPVDERTSTDAPRSDKTTE